jgi:hypothetical protein
MKMREPSSRSENKVQSVVKFTATSRRAFKPGRGSSPQP